MGFGFNSRADNFVAKCYRKEGMNENSSNIHTLVNVNAPVVATTSWWLHFSAQVVA